MRALLLLSVVVVMAPVRSQDASLLPGLLQELRAAENDTLRADALARICFNLIRTDPDSASLTGGQALQLAKKIGNSRALGDAHNNLGWLAAEQGEFERADSLLNIALGIFQKIGDPKHTSVTLSNLGWLTEKRGDSVGSVELFQQALRLSEAAKDTASSSILFYSLGVAYRKIKDHAQSVAHLQRSMAFERVLGRKGKEANCAVALANTYKQQGDTTAALHAYAQATGLYRGLRDHQGWGITEENVGDLYLKRSPRTALAHYRLALAQYDSIHSVLDKAYVLQRIGSTQVSLGDLKSGEASLKEGLILSSGSGDPQLSTDYELAFAQLFAKKGDGDAAVLHFERYVFLKDSLQGADTQRELARLRTAFETERKEKDNAILRAENNEQQERLKRRDVQLYGSLALGLLALVAAILFFRHYRQKREHARVLEGLNQRLANSNAEITEVNGLLEMKLLRSQMNPHFIYNCLNSAAQMTQAGKQVEALAYLQGFARLLRMVLDHSVSDTVRVRDEMEFLCQYLKLESQRLEGLHYEVTADPELLDDEAELPALITQPFVENAVWHGLAHKQGERTLKVRFSLKNDAVICTITDNGIGRTRAARLKEESNAAHASLGMQLTSERLKLLSRRLGEQDAIRIEDLADVDGIPNGTRVTVDLG
ncbi:MAG: tetratricopeptide repeat protein [Flavobacteriales bacterium]|nr:tetratricopeptide repeat protein [Flavobacteriales bacterium]